MTSFTPHGIVEGVWCWIAQRGTPVCLYCLIPQRVVWSVSDKGPAHERGSDMCTRPVVGVWTLWQDWVESQTIGCGTQQRQHSIPSVELLAVPIASDLTRSLHIGCCQDVSQTWSRGLMELMDDPSIILCASCLWRKFLCMFPLGVGILYLYFPSLRHPPSVGWK